MSYADASSMIRDGTLTLLRPDHARTIELTVPQDEDAPVKQAVLEAMNEARLRHRGDTQGA